MSESASTPAYQSVSLMRTESNMVHRTAENSSRKDAKSQRRVKFFSEVPRQSHTILPRLPVELRCDQWPPRLYDFTTVVFGKRLAMMCVVDKLADAETQSTAGEHIRNIMLVSRESRHANRTRNSIRGDLHGGSIFVFVSDDSCDRPCLRAVTGRKRAAAIEELTSFMTVQWSSALRDALECSFHNNTVDHCFSTKHTCFSRSIIVLLTTDQIESPRNCAETVNRTGITDPLTRFNLPIRFEYLVARDSIGGNQRHETDA